MKHSDSILLDVSLDLFDGDGGAAAPAAGEGAAGDGSKGGSQAVPGNTRRGRSGEYQNVRFGKQDPAAAGGPDGAGAQQQPSAAGKGKEGDVPHGAPAKPGGFVGRGGAAERTSPGASAGARDAELVPTTSNTLEDKRRAFQELVSGEYKDIYTEETQRIIDRRFRETKNLEERAARQQPIVDMLMQRYKIADGDLGKLAAAVENDDAYWSEAAEEAGMSVEQYKQFQKLQRENAALLREQKARRSQQAAQQQLQKWYSEGEQVKAAYPDFDLGAECKNPQFLSMLKAGVPVQLAYEVLHIDAIKAGVAQDTARQTEKQVVDGIRAKGARPSEAGTSPKSSFVVKDDPSKWTKKDRAEIARRVARGETIRL